MEGWKQASEVASFFIQILLEIMGRNSGICTKTGHFDQEREGNRSKR